MSHTVDLDADIGEVLLTEDGHRTRKVAELGRQISARLRGPQPHARLRAQGVAAVHGRPHAQIPLPLRIDLMEVSSYGGTATESSGLVRIMKDLSAASPTRTSCSSRTSSTPG